MVERKEKKLRNQDTVDIRLKRIVDEVTEKMKEEQAVTVRQCH